MKASICYPKYIKIQNSKTFCKSSRWWIRRAVNAHSPWTEMHFELLIEYTYYWCTRTAVAAIIKNHKQFIFHSIRNIVCHFHLNQMIYSYLYVSWQYIYIVYQYMRHWTDFYHLQPFQKMMHHQEYKMRVIFETINIA